MSSPSALPPRRPPTSRPGTTPRSTPSIQQNVVPPAGARKIRPLVYAVGIAGIAGSGALIGAILKMSQEEKEANRKARQQHTQAQAQQESTPDESQTQTQTQAQTKTQTKTWGGGNAALTAEYDKHISTLEAKRANLFGQKVALERKISEFRDSQRRAAAEEQEKKEFGLKR